MARCRREEFIGGNSTRGETQHVLKLLSSPRVKKTSDRGSLKKGGKARVQLSDKGIVQNLRMQGGEKGSSPGGGRSGEMKRRIAGEGRQNGALKWAASIPNTNFNNWTGFGGRNGASLGTRDIV